MRSLGGKMSQPKLITEMWAWVCTEPDGGEGIPAFEMNGHVMPLMGADKLRIESLRPMAQKVLGQGLPVKLLKFSNMEVMEELRINN